MTFKALYTWIVILFVPLSLYKINILTLTLADAMVVCFLMIYFLGILANQTRSIIINKHLFLISLFIFVHALIIIFLNHSGIQIDLIMRTLRFEVYLIFVALFSKKYFDTGLGLKLLKYISLFSSLFLILQFIMMNFGNYYLSGYIPGLPLVSESLYDLSQQFARGYSNRPHSIFQEPAHFASYVLLYFGITLFGDYQKEKLTLITIGIALVLAGSSTGILTGIVLIILWIGKLLRGINNSKKLLGFTLTLVFLSLFAIVFIKTPNFDNFLNRTFASGTATTGRLGNYGEVFLNDNTSLKTKLIGQGMVDYDDYIPAIPRIYNYFGLIGLLTFIVYSVINWFKKSGYRKIALLILLVSTIGTEIIFGYFAVLYLAFIIDNRISHKIHNEA
jgi:hypothetical protein